MKSVFLLGLLFLSHSVFALSPLKSHWGFEAGIFVNNIGQRLSAPSGYSSEVSSISALGRVRRAFFLGKKYYFEPAFGLAIPWRTSADGSTKTFPILTNLDLQWALLNGFSLRAGPGIYLQYILGTGQSVDLNNGTSVSTFYTPSGSSLSIQFSLEGGFQIRLREKLALNFDLYLLDAASSSRRTINATVTLGVLM
jgi:hypothetical protein